MRDVYLKIVNLFGIEAVVSLVNFLNIIIIARFLNIDDFALWGVLVVLLRIGEVISRPKTDLATIYLSGTSKWQISNILSHSLVLSISFSLFVGITILLLEPYIQKLLFSKYSNYNESYIYLTVTILFLSNIFINYKYIFLAKQQSVNYGIVELIRSFAVFSFVLILIGNGALDIFGILYATIFSNIISIIISLIIFYREEDFQLDNKSKLYKEIISKGFQFYLIGIFSQINISLPILLASRFFSPEITGFLIISKNFIELVLTRFLSPFSNIAYSSLSHLDNNKSKVLVSIDLAAKCLLLMIMASMPLFLFGDHLIILFYGEKFLDDSIISIIRILLPGILIFFFSIVLTQFNYSVGRFSNLKYFFLTSVILQLLFFLLPTSEQNVFLLSIFYSFSLTIASCLFIWSFILLSLVSIQTLTNITFNSMIETIHKAYFFLIKRNTGSQ